MYIFEPLQSYELYSKLANNLVDFVIHNQNEAGRTFRHAPFVLFIACNVRWNLLLVLVDEDDVAAQDVAGIVNLRFVKHAH